jgi:hypothetical protein
MKYLSILILTIVIGFQPIESYAAQLQSSPVKKAADAPVPVHYTGLTAEDIRGMLSVSQTNTKMTKQLAGDCHTECEWDPIAQENVCNSHCDPDESGAPSGGSNRGSSGPPNWPLLILYAVIVIVILVALNSEVASETAGGPPG